MAAASDIPVRLLVLPGDGIGPEVIDQTLRLVDWASTEIGRPIMVERDLVGGVSLDAHGVPVTDACVARALEADAVLFGAVGGVSTGRSKENRG